ncbi:carbon starvation CstA family protein [Maledivibacter halophilus]|uniref:Carbon starvation protein n=1 Tax=Maledivibacter halophilus TaxID=36842 RepID=A0A1T5J4B8_9FIRM|nr:carbon starvation CstA family protein [Maledivibacter halophilus]SKC46377.1 carbon starvation protein [Maledivibacter halophilus]
MGKKTGKNLGRIGDKFIQTKEILRKILFENWINKSTGKLLSALYLVSSFLVTAMFLVVMSNTVVSVPESGIPVLLLIPMAMLFGICLKKNLPLLPMSIIFVIAILGICAVGANYPLHLKYNTWVIVFSIYTFFAISLPVWLLLAPRDYLNTVLVIGGMILGAIAILIVRPPILMPAFVGFNSISGPLWPMLLATITCGAASGVHGLISSGTTSRQLANQKDGFLVAFGGMQGETFMAGISAAMIMVMFNYNEFLNIAYKNPGGAFSQALGNSLSMLGIDPVWATTIGALTFSALLLTTLDSWARAGRYVMQELAGEKSIISKNSWISNAIYMAIAIFIMITIPYMDLWSGIAIGSLTLLTVPLCLMIVKRYEEEKPFNFKFNLFVTGPLAFVYPSAVAALIYQINGFIKSQNWVSLAMILFMTYTIGSLTVFTVKRLNRIKEARDSRKLEEV